MKRFALVLLILSLAAATAAVAAPGGPGGGDAMEGPGGPGGPGDRPRPEGPGPQGVPPFARDLFPPELVLQNQMAIGLGEPQVASIKKLLNETHSRTLDIDTDLNRAVEKLKKAIAPSHVDEGAALGYMDQVLRLETEKKKAHLEMLIRLKNLLTEEQQAKLRELQPRPPRP